MRVRRKHIDNEILSMYRERLSNPQMENASLRELISHYKSAFVTITGIKCGTIHRYASHPMCGHLGCPGCWHRQYTRFRYAASVQPEDGRTYVVTYPSVDSSVDFEHLLRTTEAAHVVSPHLWAYHAMCSPDDHDVFTVTGVFNSPGPLIEYRGWNQGYDYELTSFPTIADAVIGWTDEVSLPFTWDNYDAFLWATKGFVFKPWMGVYLR